MVTMPEEPNEKQTKEEEEEQVKEKKEEENGGNPDPASVSAIQVAEKLAERIDAGNKKAEEILVRQEKLAALNMLGGSSNAGQAPPPKKTEDEKWAEGAKERYAGTGMDPTPGENKDAF